MTQTIQLYSYDAQLAFLQEILDLIESFKVVNPKDFFKYSDYNESLWQVEYNFFRTEEIVVLIEYRKIPETRLELENYSDEFNQNSTTIGDKKEELKFQLSIEALGYKVIVTTPIRHVNEQTAGGLATKIRHLVEVHRALHGSYFKRNVNDTYIVEMKRAFSKATKPH